MTPADQQVDRVVAAMAESRREPSMAARAIAANGKVAALDKAIIRHERDTAPAIRLLQHVLAELDQDLEFTAHDGGSTPITVDDVENAVLEIALAVSALTVARVAAVES